LRDPDGKLTFDKLADEFDLKDFKPLEVKVRPTHAMPAKGEPGMEG